MCISGTPGSGITSSSSSFSSTVQYQYAILSPHAFISFVPVPFAGGNCDRKNNLTLGNFYLSMFRIAYLSFVCIMVVVCNCNYTVHA